MHLCVYVGKRIKDVIKRQTGEGPAETGGACCSVEVGSGLGSTAGSWGGSQEVAVCVWGCGAWAGCRSGLGCGCSEEGRKGSGRNQLPGHWVPVGHSLWVLTEMQVKS